MSERLGELKDRVQLRGFRPGKVPVTHLKKVYGRSVMAETIEAVIREMNAKIVEERGLKLAMEPKVTMPEDRRVENRSAAKPISPTRWRSRCCRRSRSPTSSRFRSSG